MSLFHQVLACPRCDAKPLTINDAVYSCKSCRTEFPSLDGIPFLFPEPGYSLGEWRERLNFVIRQYQYDISCIEQRLKDAKLLPKTKLRLEYLAASYIEQTALKKELLSPLEIEKLHGAFDAYLALKTRLPQRQGLTTYYANMHRDWSWGEEDRTSASPFW